MKIIDIKNQAQPDPYIIEYGDKYYIYCTGFDGVHCYESDDLFKGWKFVGTVLSVKGQKEYWAPSVIEIEGKFYMYYSSMPTDSNDAHCERLKVAVCDRPDGTFEYVKDIAEPFSIDAHVVKNETGLYLFYSINDYESERAGTYVVCDKMINPLNVCGSPKTMIRPTIEEEIYQKDRFKKGQDWYTIEGAFYFKEKGVHYLIYSANSYLKPEYHLGYCVCRDDCDELDKLEFEKVSKNSFKPLLTGDETETSTGHNSLIKVNGEYYIVYHGRDINSSYSDDLKRDDRTARVCRLIVANGILSVKRL